MKRVTPAEGQESVWDYPRPPPVEPSSEHVIVRLGGVVVAESREALRVLETSHPPVYYLPREAFVDGALEPAPGRSVCEFKGAASYLSVRGGSAVAESAGWTYPEPMAGFEELRGTVALYPGRMDSCTVDGETVQPQPGDFYGGWITARVVGPFKGAPCTMFW